MKLESFTFILCFCVISVKSQASSNEGEPTLLSCVHSRRQRAIGIMTLPNSKVNIATYKTNMQVIRKRQKAVDDISLLFTFFTENWIFLQIKQVQQNSNFFLQSRLLHQSTGCAEVSF